MTIRYIAKYSVYCTRENFGGGNFWQIITAKAIGEENFGKSAGNLSVTLLYLYMYIYWQGIGGELYHLPKFSHVQ